MGRAVSAAIFAALTLAGCVTPPVSDEQAGPYPANYKMLVADQVKADFFDPFTLQDVWISAPIKSIIPAGGPFEPPPYGWAVCLRANGKNRMGAYAGRQVTSYFIRDGKLVAETGNSIFGLDCHAAEYTEWPEMENLGAKRP